MSLFDKIKKIFQSEKQPASGSSSADGHARAWEKERNRRLNEKEPQLKDWIIALVKEQGSLTFSWESGGDEAFLDFDEKITEYDRLHNLIEYMLLKLDISSAGEFKMNGKGVIYIIDNLVKVQYSSVYKEVVDYNEETDEEVFGEEELDGGEKTLFAL